MRQHTRRFLPPRVAKRLDRLEATSQQVLGDRLHHHASEPLTLETGDDQPGHQLDGIGGDRAGGERRGTGDVGGRCVENEPDRDIVHIDDPPAGAPLQQNGGDQASFSSSGLAGLYRSFPADRIKFPEDT